MIQNVLREMGGIAAFGVISVSLFFAVFTGVLLWALAQRPAFCERMRALPLEDGSIKPEPNRPPLASLRTELVPALPGGQGEAPPDNPLPPRGGFPQP